MTFILTSVDVQGSSLEPSSKTHFLVPQARQL